MRRCVYTNVEEKPNNQIFSILKKRNPKNSRGELLINDVKINFKNFNFNFLIFSLILMRKNKQKLIFYLNDKNFNEGNSPFKSPQSRLFIKIFRTSACLFVWVCCFSYRHHI